MTRSRKIEKEIKDSFEWVPVAVDHSQEDPSEYTNINATIFCPYIDHRKRGFMHRKCVTGCDDANPANKNYHYWQTKEFKDKGGLIQFCKLQRDPETDFEKCESGFKKCQFYKLKKAEEKIKK